MRDVNCSLAFQFLPSGRDIVADDGHPVCKRQIPRLAVGGRRHDQTTDVRFGVVKEVFRFGLILDRRVQEPHHLPHNFPLPARIRACASALARQLVSVRGVVSGRRLGGTGSPLCIMGLSLLQHGL